MSTQKIILGKTGEALAIEFLKNKGYKILATNFKSKLGEIDIIAKDKDAICFVEVKTRASAEFGMPQESVDVHKQHQLSRVALSYLKNNKLLDSRARFDVLSVYLDCDEPKIDLIRNAFELSSHYSY